MENFSSSEIVCSILGVIAFVAVAVLLIILWRKGLLTQKAFDALGDLVDGVIVPEDGPIGTLAYSPGWPCGPWNSLSSPANSTRRGTLTPSAGRRHWSWWKNTLQPAARP